MSSKLYRRVTLTCAAFTTVIGAVTVIGWVTGLESLASIRRNYIPMAPSTGLLFAVLGMLMLARGMVSRWLFNGLTMAVAAVAMIKLIEFVSGRSFGIEELLVADPAMFGSVQKGRMSPITAFNFLLVAFATLALPLPKLRAASGPAAAVAMGISFVVILGYLHGTPLLYYGHIIPVALPTACAFFLLGGSIVAAAGPEFWPLKPMVGDSTRAVLLRWFLPAVVAVALVEGFIRTKALTQHLNPALPSALSTLLYTFVIAAVIFKVAGTVGGRIDQAESERNAARHELELLNQELEQRIAARTQELSAKNEQMQEDLTMARELQLALLPQHFPSVPSEATPRESALEFFSFYYPTGTVSGDFFDVFPVSDTSVGIFICDVMGHGVRAALVTSMMRALLEEHSGSESDPGKLLTEINAHFLSILKHTRTTLFATAVMVIADVEKSELVFANAGHPKPLHIRRQKGDAVPLTGVGARGPALGLFPGITYSTARVGLSRGDLIMLFTDGLFEVESPDERLYSQEDLLRVVQKRIGLPAGELLEGVLADVRDFTKRADFDDDVCLIGMEIRDGHLIQRLKEEETVREFANSV